VCNETDGKSTCGLFIQVPFIVGLVLVEEVRVTGMCMFLKNYQGQCGEWLTRGAGIEGCADEEYFGPQSRV
jgi:hypothetical protein